MTQSTGTPCTPEVAGRIVWGHPLKLVQKRDMNFNPPKPVFKEDGSPVMQTSCGIAYPKAEFMQQIWPFMTQEAAKGYPNGVPQNFSWKLDDGDGMDSNNKPFAEREGYAGHYVLTVVSNTGQPPSLFKFNPQTGGYDVLTENDIKCGDYIAAALNFVVNVPTIRTHTPSLYVNPQGFEFVGYGKAIVSANAINPMAAFGGRQRQLPPGASLQPMSGAPAGVAAPGMGGGGAPMQQQPMMQPAPQQAIPMGGYPQQPVQAPQYAPQPQQQPMQQPGGYPPPAHDFVQGGGGAPSGMQQQPMMQPAPMQQPQYAPQPQQQPMQQPGGYPVQQQPGMMPPR